MANNAGPAGLNPAGAWPPLRRLQSAGRCRSGTAARCTTSQHGRCQRRCSTSSSARPQRGHAARP
eukprot:3267129-Lingulodinium_polyedra.AAC.1